MEITKEELSKVKVPYGRVLVELPYEQVEETTSGLKIVAYSDELKSALTARSGKVIAINNNVDYPEKNLSFVPEREVEVGDKVWWTQNGIYEVLKNEDSVMKVIRCESKVYVVMNYYELVLRERNGEYLGLNDKVILRPIEKKLESSLFDLSMTSMAKPDRHILEVVYVPSFKGRYRDIDVNGHVIRNKNMVTRCKVGDKVHLMGQGARLAMLEDELNLTLEKHLHYIKSADIGGIV